VGGSANFEAFANLTIDPVDWIFDPNQNPATFTAQRSVLAKYRVSHRHGSAVRVRVRDRWRKHHGREAPKRPSLLSRPCNAAHQVPGNWKGFGDSYSEHDVMDCQCRRATGGRLESVLYRAARSAILFGGVGPVAGKQDQACSLDKIHYSPHQHIRRMGARGRPRHSEPDGACHGRQQNSLRELQQPYKLRGSGTS